MSISDKVYNLTPYMKYHPGGVDELMKAAGINATDLFNLVHPWVNFQSMLEKCVVGNYINPKKESASATAGVGSAKNENKNVNLKASTQFNSKIDPNKAPSLDSYQTIEKVVFVIYTRNLNEVFNEFVMIDKNTLLNQLILNIYLYDILYEYTIGKFTSITYFIGNFYCFKNKISFIVLPALVSNHYDG